MGSPGWAGAGAESPRAAWARSVARWLPAFLLVGGVVFDLLMPTHYTASPFLSAASLVAAPLFSLRGTAAVAATAAVASVLLATFHSGSDRALSVPEVVTVCTVALLALAINRVVRRNFRQLATVRVVAEAQSFAILDAYTEAGGNFIDTADVYSAWVPGNSGGESQTIIGTWLAARGRRDEVVIATNVGGGSSEPRGLRAEVIKADVEASLRRLRI